MPLNTRNEEYELPPDAWLLRGGDFDAKEVADSADLCFKKYDEYGLSVFGADLPGPADVFSRDRRIDRFPAGHYASVQDLRDANLDFRPTGKAPHYTVTLPDLAPETIDRFLDALARRTENPRFAVKQDSD